MIKKMFYPLAVCIIVCVTCYSYSVQKELSDELLRLHITANGNSAVDQRVKLKIRDEIIKEAKKEFEHISDKKECKKLLIQMSGEIEKTANNILRENDLDYTAKVEIRRMYIPRKSYDGIILPEGSYDALNVKLGKAEGENWWCVVYPPLCFTEETYGKLSKEAEEYLKRTLSSESYALIKEEGLSAEYKFKTIELLQKIKKNLNL